MGEDVPQAGRRGCPPTAEYQRCRKEQEARLAAARAELPKATTRGFIASLLCLLLRFLPAALLGF